MASTKPTTVLLVRHGQTPTTGKILPGRTKGLNLSKDGEIQAEIAAEMIFEAFGKDVSAVYSSPMERARQTAAPIAKITGCKIEVDDDLNECDFGKWTGKSLDKLSKLDAWEIVQRNPSSFTFPGGESFLEMQHRMHSALLDLAGAHRGEVIVCVSHADTIKAALCMAFGSGLDSFQRIAIAPASISAVLYSNPPVVLCTNSTELKEVKPT